MQFKKKAGLGWPHGTYRAMAANGSDLLNWHKATTAGNQRNGSNFKEFHENMDFDEATLKRVREEEEEMLQGTLKSLQDEAMGIIPKMDKGENGKKMKTKRLVQVQNKDAKQDKDEETSAIDNTHTHTHYQGRTSKR